MSKKISKRKLWQKKEAARRRREAKEARRRELLFRRFQEIPREKRARLKLEEMCRIREKRAEEYKAWRRERAAEVTEAERKHEILHRRWDMLGWEASVGRATPRITVHLRKITD
jgi:hypothetical protein